MFIGNRFRILTDEVNASNPLSDSLAEGMLNTAQYVILRILPDAALKLRFSLRSPTMFIMEIDFCKYDFMQVAFAATCFFKLPICANSAM